MLERLLLVFASLPAWLQLSSLAEFLFEADSSAWDVRLHAGKSFKILQRARDALPHSERRKGHKRVSHFSTVHWLSIVNLVEYLLLRQHPLAQLEPKSLVHIHRLRRDVRADRR